MAMFWVRASTMPAPATVLPNGVRAGSTGGGGRGGFCCALTTWKIAKTSMQAAATGSTNFPSFFRIAHLSHSTGRARGRFHALDPAVVHVNDPVAEAEDAVVVGDHD